MKNKKLLFNILTALAGIAFVVVFVLYCINPTILGAGGVTGSMAIAVFSRLCAKNVAGVAKLFITEVTTITSVTLTAGEISAITVNGANRFMEVQGDIDSMVYEEIGEGVGNNIKYTHRIGLNITKVTQAVNTLRNSLADGSPCGMIAIVQDSNGLAWLVGYNTTDLKTRGLRLKEDSRSTGSKPADAEGNMVKLTLETESGYLALKFDATLTANLLAGTWTTIVTYGT